MAAPDAGLAFADYPSPVTNQTAIKYIVKKFIYKERVLLTL